MEKNNLLKNLDFARNPEASQVNKQIKSRKLLDALENRNGNKIGRSELRGLIVSQLGVTAPNVVNLWIDYLVSCKYLQIDPDTINSNTMHPTNRTSYIISL